ncbi:MAG: DUF2238 domain-containing protein, partial [Gammaproteobacteria bacterium]
MRCLGTLSVQRLVSGLLALLVLEWSLLAWDPVDRETWLLENVLLVAFVLALIGTWRRFRFSRGAYVLLFVYLALHIVGGHYTYSRVPYETLFQSLFDWSPGAAFGWTRNHYDRLLHLLFGLLLAEPAREMLVHHGVPVGLSYRLSVLLLM